MVDYRLLRTHCRVQDHLLVARQRLEAAAFACYTAGLRPCGDEINRFVEQDLDALFRQVIGRSRTKGCAQEPGQALPRTQRTDFSG